MWDNCSKSLKDKLQKLHNRAGRIITRSGYEIRSTEVLDQLGWQQLEDPWSTNKAMLMFKVVHDLVPLVMVMFSHGDARTCSCELCGFIPHSQLTITIYRED